MSAHNTADRQASIRGQPDPEDVSDRYPWLNHGWALKAGTDVPVRRRIDWRGGRRLVLADAGDTNMENGTPGQSSKQADSSGHSSHQMLTHIP